MTQHNAHTVAFYRYMSECYAHAGAHDHAVGASQYASWLEYETRA